MDPLEVTLLLDLLRKILVQHLPQNHHMKGVPYYLRGTHQASSHQQQTLLLEDVHSQVFKGYWYLSTVLMAFAVFNKYVSSFSTYLGFDVIFGHPNVPIQLARVFSGCVACNR